MCDFNENFAQTYKEKCECGREIEVSTQQDQYKNKLMKVKMKVYRWLHTAEEWMFFCYVDSEEEYHNLIKNKGYNPKLFKLEK